MYLRMIYITLLGLVLTLSISGIAVADDDDTDTSVVTEYLDNLPSEEGEISFTFKLDADGEESPFFRRYHDPFDGDSFFLNRLYYRAWPNDGSMLSFDSSHSWDSSWRAEGEWRELGRWMADFDINDYGHVDIPMRMYVGRRDMHAGISIGKPGGNIFDVGYTHRGSRSALEPGGDFSTIWETDDVDLGYTFDLSSWESSIQFKHRAFDANRVGVEDIVHTTWVFRSERQFGDSTFIEGNVLYSDSDLSNDRNMSSFRIGGYGRFLNAFGIDRMNITSHTSLEKRSNGPSRLHPAGDTFNFDIGAKWKATPDLKLNALYKIQNTDHSYPNRTAILEYFVFPEGDGPGAGEILTNTISTNTFNIGGRYKFSDELDGSASWTGLKRGGLDNTGIRAEGSPYLWWDKENNYVYIMRYRPSGGRVVGSGDWQLKYTKNGRSNKWRNSSVNDEHLTIDWTAMLRDDAWFYVGGGFLRTSSGLPELSEWRQKGSEYGGGFSWDFSEGWNLNGNYWNYDVSGADGYDQTTFNAGLTYRATGNWELGLLYQNIDGSFDILTPFDYDVERLLLNIGFEW